MSPKPKSNGIRRSAPAFRLLSLLVALPLLAPAARAQTWNEAGDAGALPGTAQITVGSGPLTTIRGELASESDVDMYCIRIETPASFLAALQCVVIQGPNLWLFNAAGQGVAANSFCQGGDKRILSTFVSGSGTYYLAVSFNGVDPYAGPDPIWVPGNMSERAPDGAGAAGTVTSWQGAGQVQPLNPYQINLSGVGYCDAATPVSPPSWGRLKVVYR